MPSIRECYITLGLSPSGLNTRKQPYSQKEIRQAFRKKALNVHPDKIRTPEATEQFQKLNKAYNILNGTDQCAIEEEAPKKKKDVFNNYDQINEQLNSGAISVLQLRNNVGCTKANMILSLYLNRFSTYWAWPTEEKDVQANMICKLILSNRLQLSDVKRFPSDVVYYFTGFHPILGRLSRNEPWKNFINNTDYPLNVKYIKENSGYLNILLPLLWEGILTEEELKSIKYRDAEYGLYKEFVKTAPWNDRAKTRDYFDKIQECKPIYINLINTIFKYIDEELERIEKRYPRSMYYCNKKLWHHDLRTRFLKDAKIEIEILIDKKIPDLTIISLENWIKDLRYSLVELIYDFSDRGEANKKSSYLGYFFKALAGVVLAILGLFIPLGFAKYRDTFFRTQTAAKLNGLARTIKATEVEDLRGIKCSKR